MNRIPEFLIIGAAKSGTTSLYYYLGQHPDIYFPPEIKEPGYLCFAGLVYAALDNGLPDLWKSAITQQDAYERLFFDAKNKLVTGEATPEYLFLADQTITNIIRLYKERANDLKFVVILRNPIERVWSHYWMMKRDGYENLPYAQATNPDVIAQRLRAGWNPAYDYLGYGYYGQQLSTYFTYFNPKQFHIVLFEDFKSKPIECCQKIFSFLGVDAAFTPNVSVKHNLSGKLRFPVLHNWLFTQEHLLKSIARYLFNNQILQSIKSKIMRVNVQKIEMPDDEKARLLGLYQEDVQLLSKLIQRDLTHWLSL